MNKKGFTLIELLAVLAIIALIGMIAIPNVVSLMDNNKKDQMVNDAERLISLAKNALAADRDFRKQGATATWHKTMAALDPNNSINPDPDGGNYDKEASYVDYTKNTGYCVYLKGTKRVVKTDSGGCVREEQLSRSSVKDGN